MGGLSFSGALDLKVFSKNKRFSKTVKIKKIFALDASTLLKRALGFANIDPLMHRYATPIFVN